MYPYSVNVNTGQSLRKHYLQYLVDYECHFDRHDPTLAKGIVQRIVDDMEAEIVAARKKAEQVVLRKLGILPTAADSTSTDAAADETNKAVFGLTADDATAAGATGDEEDGDEEPRNGELKRAPASNEFAYRGVHGALVNPRNSSTRTVAKHLLQQSFAGPSQKPNNPVGLRPANDSASFCPDPNASRAVAGDLQFQAFNAGGGFEDDSNAYLTPPLGDARHANAHSRAALDEQRLRPADQMDYSENPGTREPTGNSTADYDGDSNCHDEEEEVQVEVDEEGRVVRVLDADPKQLDPEPSASANNTNGKSPPIAIPAVSSSVLFGVNTHLPSRALLSSHVHGSNNANAFWLRAFCFTDD